MFENIDFNINEKQFSNRTLDLKQINKGNIIIKEIPRLQEKILKSNHHEIANSFIVALIVIVILLCIAYKYKYNIKCKRDKQQPSEKETTQIENPF